jgi:hypothetical protein
MTGPETPAGTATKGGIARTLFFIIVGPIAWGAHHMTIYASHTLICSLGLSSTSMLGWEPMTAISAATTAIALALIASPLIAPEAITRRLGIKHGEDWPFYRCLSAVLAVLSAAGIAWTGTMAFVIPACLPLR